MKINHIFVSYSDGFPIRHTAGNTKITFIGRGLLALGDRVLLLNKFYSRNNIAPAKGRVEGIEYVSFPKIGNKILSSILNTFKTLILIKNEKSKDAINVVYVGCGNFFLLAPIAIYAKAKGYKVAFILEEYQAGTNSSFVYKVNGYFHSNYLGYFVDYILPISEFLIRKSKRFRKPIFKFPICADFNKKGEIRLCDSSETYFLYCASALYKKAFEFVINSYVSAFGKDSNIHLHLVLSGQEESIKEDLLYVERMGLLSNVSIMTQIPYEELLNEYSNAEGLLIPLFKENIQDVARFSQKISEYLSTQRPVLSTNTGEVEFYFKHGETMFIAKDTTPEEYGKLMSYVVHNPKKANDVGLAGFELGKSLFDYRIISRDLKKFIEYYAL